MFNAINGTKKMRRFTVNKYLLSQLMIASSSSLLPLFLMKYGFEIADSGWAAVLTRDFYSNAEMAGRASPWILTWAIGALLSSGNSFNLSALRFATFAPIFLSAIFTYLVFHFYGYRSRIVTIGIMVAGLVCYSAFSVYFINYNTISACLFVISISFLFFSGKFPSNGTWSYLLCFFAGVLYTLSSLSRIASAALIIPCAFVIFSFYSLRIRPYVAFLLGATCCALVLCFAFYKTGHLKYVAEDITSFIYSALVSNNNASHSRMELITVLLRSVISSFGWALVFLLSFFSFFDALKNRKSYKIAISVGAVFFLVLAERSVYLSIFPSILVLLLLGNAPLSTKSPKFMLPITGVLFSLIFPLGSMNGFTNSCFALWLLIPGIIVYLAGSTKYWVAIAATAVAANISIYNAFVKPYWDHNVFSLECTLRNKNVGKLHTSCDRKRVLDEAVEAISRYSDTRDEIFVYQNSPMIYVLTGQRPWIPYPWPYLIPIQRIEKSFFERSKTSLPKVVVREKLSPFNEEWPNTDQLPIETFRRGHDYSIFYQTFFRAHGYVPVYENTMFEVFAMERPKANAAEPR